MGAVMQQIGHEGIWSVGQIPNIQFRVKTVSQTSDKAVQSKASQEDESNWSIP